MGALPGGKSFGEVTGIWWGGATMQGGKLAPSLLHPAWPASRTSSLKSLGTACCREPEEWLTMLSRCSVLSSISFQVCAVTPWACQVATSRTKTSLPPASGLNPQLPSMEGEGMWHDESV